MNKIIGRRGRPIGYRLSEASKRAISMSKTGQRHRPETKDKISKSLTMYFRTKNPISEEMICKYSRYDDDSAEWFDSIREELDYCMEIITEKSLRNKNKMELTCGSNIEYFSHNITPELIYLYKERCEKEICFLEE
jgi:hypothetical protein